MAHVLEYRPVGALGRMTVVAGIHVGVLYAIAAGLGIAPVPEIVRTEMVTPVDTVIPDEPPPRTVFVPEHRDVIIPQPTVDFDPPDVAPTIAVQVMRDPPPITRVETGSGETGIPTTNVMQDSRYPLSQPFYPPQSKRDGEEGAADVEVYVLPNGRVGDARIARSTGFERLDRAALEEARKRWRFKPATRAGEAVPEWHKVRVVFELTEAR
jgi:protein TonB